MVEAYTPIPCVHCHMVSMDKRWIETSVRLMARRTTFAPSNGLRTCTFSFTTHEAPPVPSGVVGGHRGSVLIARPAW